MPNLQLTVSFNTDTSEVSVSGDIPDFATALRMLHDGQSFIYHVAAAQMAQEQPRIEVVGVMPQ